MKGNYSRKYSFVCCVCFQFAPSARYFCVSKPSQQSLGWTRQGAAHLLLGWFVHNLNWAHFSSCAMRQRACNVVNGNALRWLSTDLNRHKRMLLTYKERSARKSMRWARRDRKLSTFAEFVHIGRQHLLFRTDLSLNTILRPKIGKMKKSR